MRFGTCKLNRSGFNGEKIRKITAHIKKCFIIDTATNSQKIHKPFCMEKCFLTINKLIGLFKSV